MTNGVGPVPPEGVFLVLRDRSEVPVACDYLGCWEGTHWWAVVRPPGVTVDRFEALKIGVLPARTEVIVTLTGSAGRGGSPPGGTG